MFFDMRKVGLTLVAVFLIVIGVYGTVTFWDVYHESYSLFQQTTGALVLGLFVTGAPILFGVGYLLIYLCRTTEVEVAYKAELDRAIRDLNGGGPPALR